jgi:predicted transcriptional regulator of viral defense system
MTQDNSRYAQPQGIKLLEAAVKEFGPLFRMDQIRPLARAQNITDVNLRYILSTLAKANWIEILKRGIYLVKSPLFSEEISAFAIASVLVQPVAISHWSACAHHGFTTQNPSMIQATTPQKVLTPEMRTGAANRPRGRSVWKVAGYDFEFIKISQKNFWGFEQIWVNSWQRINITDRERTALDLIARPDIFGGFSAALEIFEAAIDRIDHNRLIGYALRYDTGSVIKRLGWALEKIGVNNVSLERLEKYPVKRYYPLDPALPVQGVKNTRWKIIENLNRS